MKKFIVMIFLWAGCAAGIWANDSIRDEKFSADAPLLQQLTHVKKKTDKFNLFLHLRGSFNSSFDNGFKGGKFMMDELRVEAKGKLNHWLSYHYRQRLSGTNERIDRADNIPSTIDCANVGIQLNKRASLLLGKQSATYGGIEFDQNPIEIYELCDVEQYMECFMTGVNFGYDITPNHQINLQVLNNRNASFNQTYGVVANEQGEMPPLKDAKLPLVYNINWNGNFNDVFKTRYSAAVLSETKGHLMYYYALGNELTLNKWNAFFDFMYSKEGIDRTGVISNIVGRKQGYNMTDVSYMALVAQCKYRFLPQWQVFAKGMYETASVDKVHEYAPKGKYRTSWGYLAGIEFYPTKSNLHFFLTYVGRSYDYTSKAMAMGQNDYDTHRISAGFIWNMSVF